MFLATIINFASQAETLLISLAEEPDEPKNVVVNTGTGSGKTECFMLPLIGRLLLERETKGSRGQLNKWWNREASTRDVWSSQRSGQVSSSSGLRALLLYPTNALVEDQITRLRTAAVRATESDEPLFYFGRYTGETPGGSWNQLGPLNFALEVNAAGSEIKEQIRLNQSVPNNDGQFAQPLSEK